MSNRMGLLWIAVASIVLAAGCGSSSSNSNTKTNTTPPTVQPAAQNGCGNSTALTAGDGTGSCGITASGGQGPYTWTVNNTACQSTLTVFDAGTGLGCIVSGADNSNLAIQPLSSSASAHSSATTSARTRVTPMASSTSVTVPVNASVTGANGKSSTLPGFTITVSIKALGIGSTSLPNGTVGVAYPATSVSGSGGVPPYTWTITGLPAGLIGTGAQVSGTPTQSGTFTITVRVNDSEATHVSVQVTLSLTISPASSSPLAISTGSSLKGASLGSTYSVAITASGGTPNYTWNLASGSVLPSGLTLTSGTPSATISGTPTETGTFSFTVDVQDSASTPATAQATFMVTVTGSSTLNCPSTVNLTLCGTYALGLAGAKGAQGFVEIGFVIVVNNSGNVISGEGHSNDSSGDPAITITGGSYAMDPSGDGRGLLTLIDNTATVRTFRFALESSANGPGANIVEFDSTGDIAEGSLEGPELLTAPTPASPIAPPPANTALTLPLQGVNAASQRAALLGLFAIGANGCDGSSGSFNSVAGESIVTNTAGTLNTGLTATGSCTTPDPMGVGTIQVTLAGGTPFTNNTLNFVYIDVNFGGQFAGLFILETDAIGNNQPILGGDASVNQPFGNNPASAIATQCAPGCLFVSTGSKAGTIAAHMGIASLVRFTATASTTTTGTVSGVMDENGAGTITSAVAWPYTSITADSNGVGTLTGSGQATIHFISGGNEVVTLDESGRVMTGNIRPQNLSSPYSIESPGQNYIAINTSRTLGDVGLSGVLIPSGAASGNFSGAFDLVSEAGETTGFVPAGSYSGIDGTTGRSTGTANLVNTSTGNIVIYAFRHRVFIVLDMQSLDPYLIEARLQ